MAIKKSSKGSEGVPSSEPSKEPKQVEESSFVHPIVLSYNIVRRGGGWSMATVTTQGDSVVSVEYTAPDMKNIAYENFRIAISKSLMAE